MVTLDDVALASSDAVNASTPVSLPVSRDIATAAVDSHTVVNETTGGIEVSMNDSGLSHPDPSPVLSPASSEVNSKFESKNTEISVSGSISTVKAADAAGSSSDLYNAYKGPEEKHEASEILDSSHNASSNLEPGELTEKDVTASEKDAESKAEPDDWEDAAEISTPKLEISDDRKQLDGDGSGGNSKKHSRDFLLTFSEQCHVLPINVYIGPDIAISHHVDREPYPNSGRVVDRLSGGPRPDRRGSGMLDEGNKPWNRPPGQSAGRDPLMHPIRHA